MLNRDTLLTAILAASGGKFVVQYDDMGKPSVMVRIPRFNLEDIDPALGTGPHPAFVVNGVEKNEILIGAYQAVVDEGRACSLPGVLPTVSINFDAAKRACTDKGPGWHMMTAWEWAAVALWCMRNGTQPRGNTENGRAHNARWETSVRADRRNPGDSSGTPRTLTGSGPAAWRHDDTHQGIADLVGNVWEWNDGLKLVDGRFFFPDDNDFNLDEADWPATPVYMDATTGPIDGEISAANGAPVLNNQITRFSETPNPPGGGDMRDFTFTHRSGENGWRTMDVAGTYDSLPEAVRQKMGALLISPKLTSAGDLINSDIRGAVWCRNYGTRFPLRGGAFNVASNAGLAALRLTIRRAHVNSAVGFRPAFIL